MNSTSTNQNTLPRSKSSASHVLVCIVNLPQRVSESQIMSFFSKFVKIVKCQTKRLMEGGKISQRDSYIVLKEQKDLDILLKQNVIFSGRKLSFHESKAKETGKSSHIKCMVVDSMNMSINMEKVVSFLGQYGTPSEVYLYKRFEEEARKVAIFMFENGDEEAYSLLKDDKSSVLGPIVRFFRYEITPKHLKWFRNTKEKYEVYIKNKTILTDSEDTCAQNEEESAPVLKISDSIEKRLELLSGKGKTPLLTSQNRLFEFKLNFELRRQYHFNVEKELYLFFKHVRKFNMFEIGVHLDREKRHLDWFLVLMKLGTRTFTELSGREEDGVWKPTRELKTMVKKLSHISSGNLSESNPIGN